MPLIQARGTCNSPPCLYAVYNNLEEQGQKEGSYIIWQCSGSVRASFSALGRVPLLEWYVTWVMSSASLSSFACTHHGICVKCFTYCSVLKSWSPPFPRSLGQRTRVLLPSSWSPARSAGHRRGAPQVLDTWRSARELPTRLHTCTPSKGLVAEGSSVGSRVSTVVEGECDLWSRLQIPGVSLGGKWCGGCFSGLLRREQCWVLGDDHMLILGSAGAQGWVILHPCLKRFRLSRK